MSDRTDIEIISPISTTDESLAISLSRAEIDQQIATARAYPRSIQNSVSNIMTLATLDAETAESCIYALPRGGKPIKGPSARFAEIVSSQWGNCRIASRVVHVDKTEKYIEAEGLFHDLETNMARRALVRRRISDKHGRVLNEDMITVTGNAAASIAARNAILAGVPRAVWGKAYQRCEQVLAGDVKTLAVTIEQTMKAFASFGVTPERVCASLELAGIGDIKIDHIPTLRGMFSALKNGEATVEEMFPAPAKPLATKSASPPAPAADTKTEAAPATSTETTPPAQEEPVAKMKRPVPPTPPGV